jgi:hypothetical protein
MRESAGTASKIMLAFAIAATLGTARMPERHPSRATSFEWMADVPQRLKILEQHATDAARETMRMTPSLRGRSAPQPPAAGAGSVQ